MNEAWRIKQSILVSVKILIFSLFEGCFYRNGPALTKLASACGLLIVTYTRGVNYKKSIIYRCLPFKFDLPLGNDKGSAREMT